MSARQNKTYVLCVLVMLVIVFASCDNATGAAKRQETPLDGNPFVGEWISTEYDLIRNFRIWPTVYNVIFTKTNMTALSHYAMDSVPKPFALYNNIEYTILSDNEIGLLRDSNHSYVWSFIPECTVEIEDPSWCAGDIHTMKFMFINNDTLSIEYFRPTVFGPYPISFDPLTLIRRGKK